MPCQKENCSCKKRDPSCNPCRFRANCGNKFVGVSCRTRKPECPPRVKSGDDRILFGRVGGNHIQNVGGGQAGSN